MRSDTNLDDQFRENKEWAGAPGSLANSTMENWGRVPSDKPGIKYLSKSFSGSERNRLFYNRLGKEFFDLSAVSGLDTPADSRSLVLLDYDHDGRQDIALVNANTPLLNLFHNDIADVASSVTPGGMIAVRFVGGSRSSAPTKDWSNRDGIGAVVRVSADGWSAIRELRAGEGFAAQNSKTLLIGVGDRSKVDVSIVWPSHREQKASGVEPGTLVTFHENPADGAPDGVERAPYGPAIARRAAAAAATSRTLDLAPQDDASSRVYVTMATWCAACMKAAPQVALLKQQFDGRLTFYGVPVDANDTAEMLSEYEAKKQPAYTLLKELSGADRKSVQQILKESAGLDALPSTIVTDSEGRVLKAFAGVPTASELERIVGGN